VPQVCIARSTPVVAATSEDRGGGMTMIEPISDQRVGRFSHFPLPVVCIRRQKERSGGWTQALK
jgi:hypothetical protein